MAHERHMLIDIETEEEITEPNKSGHLYLKSDTMTTGYYGNPEAFATIIDKDGWMMTGDLVRFDEDGYMYVVDRLKDLIKYNGFMVCPAMLENAIKTINGVMECVVVGKEDENTGMIPVALVIRSDETAVTAEIIKQKINENFEDYHKLRGGVYFVDKFPHTPSGKINTYKIRKDLNDYMK